MKKAGLTGNKDTDYIILNQLEDYELTQVCQVNKYVNSLCDDEMFWNARILKHYPIPDDIVNMKKFLLFTNYRDLYIWLDEEFRGLAKIRFRLKLKKIVDLYSKKKKLPKWINRDEFLIYLKRLLFVIFTNLEKIDGSLYNNMINKDDVYIDFSELLSELK